MIPHPVSYHAVFDPSVHDALLYAAKNGFNGIQVAEESPHLSLSRLHSEQFGAVTEAASELGIYITLHAADDTASLYQTNSHLINGIRQYYKQLFDLANRVSAKLVTIHPDVPASFQTDESPVRLFPEADISAYEHVFRENIEWILKTNQAEIPVCVENANLTFETITLLLPYLERGDLFLCWDIGKSFGDTDMERFYINHLSWVKQIHLHDVRKVADNRYRSHCVIGTGEIDFPVYLTHLAGADILDHCIEVRPREKARESLDALRNL